MKLSFVYKTERIEFEVEYRSRKTLGIQIIPPGIIKVAAPKGVGQDRVIEAVKSKAKWIVQKLFVVRQNELQKRHRHYIEGESFLYMGSEYELHLILDEAYIKPKALFQYDCIYVYTATKDEEVIKESIKKWYKDKAREKILERITIYQRYFNASPSAVKVKEQKKRWGSCTSRRVLLFNWKIIMAPLEVLDYIVVHEMCHLVHMNHSKDFWTLVEGILPDYKERKLWLKRHGALMDL